MKILHVVPYYPPARIGGVGEYAARLHRALRAAGHDSQVLTRGRVSEPGVHGIAASRLGWFLRGALWARRADRFDVVHAHAGEALPLLLALAATRRHARILCTFHSSYTGMARSLRPYRLEGRRFGGGPTSLFQRTLLAWAHRAVDRCALALADLPVPITQACAREILGPGAGAATVVYHGLPPLPPETPDPGPEGCALLYVGRGGHGKRVQVLPFVLSQVRAALPDTRLRIVGFDWHQEPALREAFAERGLQEAVDWVGPVASNELTRYYRSAQVLVHPSAYEGLPLVVIEAMQCGLPVVATRVGGTEEAVEDGVTGFCVPLDDPAALAARCVELLRDPGRRAEMGRRAQARARERFAQDRHVAAYLALYQELCT